MHLGGHGLLRTGGSGCGHRHPGDARFLGVAERTAGVKGYDLRFVLLPQTLDDLDDAGMAGLVGSTYHEIVDNLTCLQV